MAERYRKMVAITDPGLVKQIERFQRAQQRRNFSETVEVLLRGALKYRNRPLAARK